MADPIVVTIVPADEADPRRILYYAYVYNTLLLGPTTTPYQDTANELLNLGYDPQRILLLRRLGVGVNQLSYKLFRAAVLEVTYLSNPRFFFPLQQNGPGAVP
jgi:hypothetical protein